jgi:2,5-diamino-6-(ribosylamino)-4(3H)-pyrimidinone 5'-phosphate reductase
VLINVVASLDGKATFCGKAASIGSPTDRMLMRALRARVDAVMTGGGTLRAEKLSLAVPENLARAREARGLKPQPLAVIATATGDVPLQTNLLDSSPDNLLVIASPETSEERLAYLSSRASVEIVTQETSAPGIRPNLTGALEALKERYAVEVLLVEGGPALNYSLVSLGLVDELFLTLAPKLLGGERPDALTMLEGLLLSPNDIEPKLVSVHLFEDELFLRYALRSEEDAIRYSLR